MANPVTVPLLVLVVVVNDLRSILADVGTESLPGSFALDGGMEFLCVNARFEHHLLNVELRHDIHRSESGPVLDTLTVYPQGHLVQGCPYFWSHFRRVHVVRSMLCR